jgi:hypothetical protein
MFERRGLREDEVEGLVTRLAEDAAWVEDLKKWKTGMIRHHMMTALRVVSEMEASGEGLKWAGAHGIRVKLPPG